MSESSSVLSVPEALVSSLGQARPLPSGRFRYRQLLPALVCSVGAVWPVVFVSLGAIQFVWQPLLVAGLLLLILVYGRRMSYKQISKHCAGSYVLLTVAGWLPFLDVKAVPVPATYQGYLLVYRWILALVLSFFALQRMKKDRGLLVLGALDGLVPLLLGLRAIQGGSWVVIGAGIVAGGIAARASQRFLPSDFFLRAVEKWIPCFVFLVGLLLVWAAGWRIYQQTGERFILASDDGPSYYAMALRMAKDPAAVFTSRLADENFFSGYYPLMGLWFRAVGPSIPSWLFWHGVGGGILALSLYGIGRSIGGWMLGLLLAWFGSADHVVLQLLATMNMETFFIPALYLAVWLWIRTRSKREIFDAIWTGLALGLATVFRPTSVLLPFVWAVLLVCERPSLSWRAIGRQAAGLLAGFAILLGLLIMRNRIAWGYWTLAGMKGKITSLQGSALWVHGQHPASVGLWPWLNVLAREPNAVWTHMVPAWRNELVQLWTHPGFGWMDLIQGLNAPGTYQAALTTVLLLLGVVGMVVALKLPGRVQLVLLTMPFYFSAFILAFDVLNARYRAPFIPALYALCCLGAQAIYQQSVDTVRRV